MFHLNRGKKILANVDFRKPHSTYRCQANKARLNRGNRQGFVGDRHQRDRLMPVEGTLREHYVLSS